MREDDTSSFFGGREDAKTFGAFKQSIHSQTVND